MYGFWEDKFKHVRNYNTLGIWEYFKRPYSMENLAPINGIEDMVKIDGPGEISEYFDNPGSLDKDASFNLKFAHTNIFPWILESYEEIGYSYLYKIAVNLGHEELASINGKLLNFIWIEEELFKNAKEKPYLTKEYAKSTRETVTTIFRSKFSDFDQGVEYGDDFLITKYHPVYVSDKNYLDIGHITDIHLDTRMDVYGQSVASVVEVKENNKLELDAKNKNRVINDQHKNMYRPLKNLVVNFNDVFENISKKLSRESDLMVITGDLIDYNRGLQTSQAFNKKAQKPSEIWDDLYANWHQLDSEDHKKDINWFVFQQRLLKLYDEHKKPIFTLLGNHDYVGYPMALWPLWGIWEGVYQMNLTRYEVALCFGPGYDQSKQFISNMKVDEDYIKWYSYYINPFSDMVVNYGGQSMFLVDWARDSEILGNKAGDMDSSTLHRAVNIFADSYQGDHDPVPQGPAGIAPLLNYFLGDPDQPPFPIRNYSIYQSWKSSDAEIKILCMHPTAICPNSGISTGEAIFDYTWEDTELQHGTFNTRREEILKDLENGNPHILLTGHSHRNMLFELNPEDNVYPLPITSKRRLDTDYMQPQNLVAVTSSGGPLPTYLPGGPLICKCKDKYETGFFYTPNKDKLLDYDDLYLYKESHPTTRYHEGADSSARGHYLKSYIGTYYTAKCPDCNMHGSDMARKPYKQHQPGGNLLLFNDEGKVKFKTEFSDTKLAKPRKAVFCEENDIFTGDMMLEDIGSEEKFYYWKPEYPIDIVSSESFTYYGYKEFPSKVQYITYLEGLLNSEKLGTDRYDVKAEDNGDGYTIVRQQIGKHNFRKLMKAATNDNNFAFTRYHFIDEVWDREITMTKSLSGRMTAFGKTIASSFSGPLHEPDIFEGLLIRFKTEPDFKKRRKICGY